MIKYTVQILNDQTGGSTVKRQLEECYECKILWIFVPLLIIAIFLGIDTPTSLGYWLIPLGILCIPIALYILGLKSRKMLIEFIKDLLIDDHINKSNATHHKPYAKSESARIGVCRRDPRFLSRIRTKTCSTSLPPDECLKRLNSLDEHVPNRLQKYLSTNYEEYCMTMPNRYGEDSVHCKVEGNDFEIFVISRTNLYEEIKAQLIGTVSSNNDEGSLIKYRFMIWNPTIRMFWIWLIALCGICLGGWYWSISINPVIYAAFAIPKLGIPYTEWKHRWNLNYCQ